MKFYVVGSEAFLGIITKLAGCLGEVRELPLRLPEDGQAIIVVDASEPPVQEKRFWERLCRTHFLLLIDTTEPQSFWKEALAWGAQDLIPPASAPFFQAVSRISKLMPTVSKGDKSPERALTIARPAHLLRKHVDLLVRGKGGTTDQLIIESCLEEIEKALDIPQSNPVRFSRNNLPS